MVLYDISMAKMRFFVVENRLFKKWSELGKMGKNGEKSLTQNPHYISTQILHVIFMKVKIYNNIMA